MLQKLLSITQTLRLPSICMLCDQYHPTSLAICEHCINQFATLSPCCYHCAHPLHDTNYFTCGKCIKQPPHFDQAIILYRFEEPLRSLIHQFKYSNGLFLAPVISQLMVKAWQNSPSNGQCLLPVPMHPKRARQRGYNQAVILTKLLAKELKIPYDLNSCQKIINTPPQASLAQLQRQRNLHKAFKSQAMPYKHVVLIDDLLTTGNTLNELAKSLKESGVERVDIWCCARAVPAT